MVMSRYRVLIRSMSWALAIAAGITALWAIWEAFVEKISGLLMSLPALPQ